MTEAEVPDRGPSPHPEGVNLYIKLPLTEVAWRTFEAIKDEHGGSLEDAAVRWILAALEQDAD